MHNQLILKLIHPSFVFLLFFLYQNVIALSKSPYTPKDPIFLSCGSMEDNNIAIDGRNWTADLNSKFGPIEQPDNKSIVATALIQGSSVTPVPYMTARISQSQFTYSFPVTPGQKFVRLYFYPTSYHGGFERSKDWFDVTVGPYTFLRNFSATLYADNWRTQTFFREFCVNVDEHQQRLNITFAPSLIDSNDSYVFINGIEIMPMPTDLYYNPPNGPGIRFIDQNSTLRVQNDTALSMVCRLNVGGNNIPPAQDTGMRRSWNDDTIFMQTDSLILSQTNFSLKYSKIQAYTAPDYVYKSGRSMGAGYYTNNLTWGIPVYPGYRYLIRLHFCEFLLEVEKANERRFDILIDNLTAEVGLDVFESSGGNLIPIYKDYIVSAGKKGETEDHALLVTIRPNRNSEYPDGFLNGMEVFRLNDTDGRLDGPNSPSSVTPAPEVAPVQPVLVIEKSNRKKTLLVAVVGAVAGLLLILSLLCFAVFWRLKKRKKLYGFYYELLACCGWFNSRKGQSARTSASSLPQERCRQFSLDEIKAATNNFDNSLIIGQGGFGNVYKGYIDDGAMSVAIKRLNQGSKQGFKEFKTEIEMLSQLRHVHLVSLIGYCKDEREMILVYDYMINGTLKEHLYDTDNDPLPWKKRLEICVGAASGLDYLHAGAAHTIIHRDIKTTNILLDENWVAKVSDFGLSKIGVNDTAVSTLVKGTWGYLDPEYARRKQLTEKSDVFSFGVVLFEVLCARKPLNQKLEEEQWNLANWARKCILNGIIHQIIDPYLMGKISPDCFNTFVETAESCVRDNGIERPTMHDVTEKLQFALELQVAADAEKKEKNPDSEYVYPEVSFRANRYANLFAESDINSSNASGSSFTDTNTTWTNN